MVGGGGCWGRGASGEEAENYDLPSTYQDVIHNSSRTMLNVGIKTSKYLYCYEIGEVAQASA